MKPTIRNVILPLFVAMLVSTSMLMAQDGPPGPPPCHPPGPPPGGPGFMPPPRIDPFDSIGLSDRQRTRIDAIRDRFEAERVTLDKQLREIGPKMRDARHSGDTMEMKRLQTQARGILEQLRAKGDQLRDQMMAVLTEAQRAEFERILRDHAPPRPMGPPDGGRPRGGPGGGMASPPSTNGGPQDLR